MLYVFENILPLLSVIVCFLVSHYFIMKACDILEDITREEVLEETEKRDSKNRIKKKEGLRGEVSRGRRAIGRKGQDGNRKHKRSGMHFNIAK